MNTFMATHENICDQALRHYEKIAKECCHWNSVIPRAIAFYREYYSEKEQKIMKPKVICICGSTRFADLHAIKRWEFEKDGNICLMINYLPMWYAEEKGFKGCHHFAEQSGLKDMLDELHLRKIDLADEVFVINVDDYIGDSTRREINYAKTNGKPVHYMEKHR